jgi:hypothetical protein
LDPEVPSGRLWLAPELPDALGNLRMDRVSLAGSRMTVSVVNGVVETTGLPASVRLLSDGRPLTTAGPLPS